MKLSELFARLSFGELSNLALGSDGSGTILEAKKPNIVLYANNAMHRLHTRFNIREDRLFLQMSGIRDIYPLRKEHSKSAEAGGSTEDIYIYDTEESPFEGNVLKILQIADQDGEIFHLNIHNSMGSMHTPEHDVLQVPHPKHGKFLSLTYQTKPEPILLAEEDKEILLPELLVPALTAHIAHEVYGNMNGQEAQSISIRHLNTYEAICREIEDKDALSVSSTADYSPFTARGFV